MVYGMVYSKGYGMAYGNVPVGIGRSICFTVCGVMFQISMSVRQRHVRTEAPVLMVSTATPVPVNQGTQEHTVRQVSIITYI